VRKRMGVMIDERPSVGAAGGDVRAVGRLRARRRPVLSGIGGIGCGGQVRWA